MSEEGEKLEILCKSPFEFRAQDAKYVKQSQAEVLCNGKESHAQNIYYKFPCLFFFHNVSRFTIPVPRECAGKENRLRLKVCSKEESPRGTKARK